MNRKTWWMILAMSGVAMGQASLMAGNRWYYQQREDGVAMGGYDAVAYFRVGDAREGKADYQFTWMGLTYYFESETHRQAFKADPEAFLPQYGGWCAMAMGVDATKYGFGAVRFAPDPTSFILVDGKLFLFSKVPGFDAKKLWEKEDRSAMVARANAFWQGREALGEKLGHLPKGMNPGAPMETAQFAPLIGEWTNTVQWLNNAQTGTYGPEITGTWSIAFGWDGFGIDDHWKQVGAAGSGGPAHRFFDPKTRKWVMVYIPANQPRSQIWLMEGSFDANGELHGAFDGVDLAGRAFMGKVRFFQIEKDSFRWEHHRSFDGGKTWIEKVAISHSKRIR